MHLAIAVTAAVVPTALLLLAFFKGDRFPEPPRVVLITYGAGVLVVPGLMAVGALRDALLPELTSPLAIIASVALLHAAIPETLLKYLVVRCYSMRTGAVDEAMDGLVYGAAASLGFAAFENVAYVLRGDLSLALVRSLTTIPMHACFGALMGYFVVRGRTLTGLAVAIVLHGFYDATLRSLANLDSVAQATHVSVSLLGPVLWAAYFTIIAVGLGATLYLTLQARDHQLGAPSPNATL